MYDISENRFIYGSTEICLGIETKIHHKIKRNTGLQITLELLNLWVLVLPVFVQKPLS